jgi:hypothetical protein
MERQRIVRAVGAAQEGRALLEWVNRTRRRLPHDAAVRLFLKKVMKEEIERSTAQWAMARAGDSQSMVIFHGMTTLDRDPPDHWK